MTNRPAPRRLAAIGALLLLSLVACGRSTSSGSPSPASSTSPSTPASSAPIVSPSSPSGTVPTTTPTSAAAAENLTATPDVKAELLAAYVRLKGQPAAYFTGPTAGSVYYGFVPSTHTYYALASFDLTKAADSLAQVDMQDGGNDGVFHKPAGGTWTGTLRGVPGPCPGIVPQSLATVWGLTYSGSCGIASGTSPAKAGTQISTNPYDLPPGTYFGQVLFFDLQLSGYGDVIFEPETWQGTAAPVSHHRTWFLLDVTPATTTARTVGGSAASAREVTGRFDADFANAVNADMVPFTNQAYSGYEITSTNPSGCSGSCETATSITQISPITPPPPNPDFVEPVSG